MYFLRLESINYVWQSLIWLLAWNLTYTFSRKSISISQGSGRSIGLLRSGDEQFKYEYACTTVVCWLSLQIAVMLQVSRKCSTKESRSYTTCVSVGVPYPTYRSSGGLLDTLLYTAISGGWGCFPSWRAWFFFLFWFACLDMAEYHTGDHVRLERGEVTKKVMRGQRSHTVYGRGLGLLKIYSICESNG